SPIRHCPGPPVPQPTPHIRSQIKTPVPIHDRQQAGEQPADRLVPVDRDPARDFAATTMGIAVLAEFPRHYSTFLGADAAVEFRSRHGLVLWSADRCAARHAAGPAWSGHGSRCLSGTQAARDIVVFRLLAAGAVPAAGIRHPRIRPVLD